MICSKIYKLYMNVEMCEMSEKRCQTNNELRDYCKPRLWEKKHR